MERASRLIVIASIALAVATDAWLAIWQPALPAATATAFAVTYLIARVSLPLALTVVFAAMYVAPALLFAVAGGGAYASDYQLTLVWLAALAGPLLAHGDVTRWHLPRPWMLPLVGWALVIALSWPIVAAREIDFSLIAARTYDTTNGAFPAPPRVAAAWIVIVALGQLIGILWIDFLWAKFSRGNLAELERSVIVPVLAGAAIGAVAGLYQGFIDLDWLNPGIWPRMGRAGGLMLDANTFGMASAIWAPVAIVVAWRLGWPVWVGVLFYVLLAASEFTSGGRTALLTLVAGTAGVLVAFAQRRGWWQPRMAPIALLLGAGVIVLAMAIAPRGGSSANPVQRVFDRLPRLHAPELTAFASEMWDRFGYGTAAARIIAEHPATGIGIGAFHVVAPGYIYRMGLTAAPSDNAQNWWRHQVAELGFLGSAPSLWMSIVIVGLIWRGGPYVEPFGTTTVLRMVLAGVGLASLLGVPTQHPATWISFATLLFWLSAMFATVSGAARVSRGWWAIALAVGIITAAGQAASVGGDLRVPIRAVRDGAPYKYGFTAPEGLSQFGELRWAARRAVEVIPVKDRWLQVAVWAPQPDVASRPITIRLWMNRRRVIEQDIHTPEPLMYVLQMPDPSAWVLLEVSASQSADSDRAVGIAHQWHAAVPRDVPPERVIR